MSDLDSLKELSVSAAEEKLFLNDAEKELMREYAEAVFGSRCDVLRQPGPDPKEDRYLAMLRLLLIAEHYGGFPDEPLSYSEARLNRFFYITDERNYSSGCYDGGCGGIETDYIGVLLSLYPDAQSFPAEDPFNELLAKLETPAGLSDCVLVERHRE